MESLMQDHPFCINSFSWLSKGSEIFSAGVPQFNITGLPGTSDSLLWILGSTHFPEIGRSFKFSCKILKLFFSTFSSLSSLHL